MKKTRPVHNLSPLAAALMLAACGGAVDSSGGAQQAGNSPASLAPDNVPVREACAHVDTPGVMHCHALIRTDEKGNFIANAGPPSTSLGATDLQNAYSIPTSGGAGKTIAIVDANDNPNLEADLQVYRAQYGLGPCTVASGCLTKVNQTGGSTLPAGDTGWGLEMSLDVDMASAACPDCKILVVEASSTSIADLGAAEIYAASVATVVSNSYGGSEDDTIEGTDAKYFSHPGVGIFVSSGDSGYGVEYPASSQYVTAVGGTKLVKASNARGWTETAWGSGFLTFLFGGGGSGCSAYIPKPSWQKDTGCKFRTVADVASNAAPSTGPAIYDTYGGASAGATGWIQVGGTSAASPLTAAIYAATGNGAADGSLSYSNPSAFNDVTSGSNGTCGGSYLCTAGKAYDGPTGNGSPNGAVLSKH